MTFAVTEDRALQAPAIHLLAPPYRLVSPPITLDQLEPTVSNGTLTVLRFTQSESASRLLHMWLPAARQRYPWCTFVLQIAKYESHDLSDLLLLAGGSGIRACVLDDGISEAHLRHSLTNPIGLNEQLVDWVGYTMARSAASLRGIALPLLQQPQVGASARTHLHALGLPSPIRWRQLARTLRALIQIQKNSQLSIERAAFANGFADHASLCRLTQNLFGLAPSVLRGTLGWEWLAYRWLTRFSRK